MKGVKTPIYAVATWVQRQLLKVKMFLAEVSKFVVLVFLHACEREKDLKINK